MSRTRRAHAARGLAAGLMVLALGAGEVLIAGSDGPEDPPPVAAAHPPRIGDQGVYEVRTEDGVTWFSFSWLPSMEWVDAEGRVRWVHVFSWNPLAEPGGSRWYFDSQTKEAVAWVDESENATGDIRDAGLARHERSESDRVAVTHFLPNVPPPCPPVMVWLRTTPPKDAPGRGACEVPGVRAWTPLPPGPGGGGPEVLWADDVSFPVRVRWPPAPGSEAVDVLRLARFTPGTAPFVSKPATPGPPPLDVAPRRVWGPDDHGVHVPFSLSEAFEFARAQVGPGSLGEFLASHPGAALTAASFSQEASAQEPREVRARTWTMEAADGHAARRVCVAQEEWSIRALPAAPASRVTRARSCADRSPLEPVEPTALPDRLPTVAAMFERWRRQNETGPTADAWGFRMRCAASPCDHVVGELAVGRAFGDRSVDVPTARGDAPSPWDADGAWGARLLVFDLDGRAMHLVETRRDSGSEWSTVFSPPRSGGSEWDKAALTPNARDPPTWEWAAVGGASVLVAGIVGAWQAVHGGLWSLYHRVRGPRVLAHPARRVIQGLVEASPGLHFRELLRRTGIGRSSLEHHLRRLEAAGYLVAVQGSRFHCYFPRGAFDHRIMCAAPILKAPVARELLAEAGRSPGVSLSQLAHRLGRAPATVHYHAARLVAAGLLESGRSGRVRAFRATSDAPAALAAAAKGRLPAAGESIGARESS